MNISESDFYQTCDFANASALMALGYNLLSLDRTSGDGRVAFVFQRKNGIETAAEAHFSGRLKLITTQYYSAQRTLKSRLHNS
ncbi:MAG: hypothetical protein WC536_01095 [Patescibacteria group bacterium]